MLLLSQAHEETTKVKPTIEKKSPKSTKIHREFSSVPKTKAKKNSKMPMGIKRACHSLHRKRGVCTRCGHMPFTFGSSRFTDSGSVGSQSLSSKTNKKAKFKKSQAFFSVHLPKQKSSFQKHPVFRSFIPPSMPWRDSNLENWQHGNSTNSHICSRRYRPGTLNTHFLMEVWWNTHFWCNDLESSSWNNH